MATDPHGWALYRNDEAAAARTPDDVARLLRRLRRRHARTQGDAPLTYRELATTTGWALGVISDYFNGKILPSTDRFDVLIQLLGANPAEQRALAVIRDRVEEAQRHQPPATRAEDLVPRQVPSFAWPLAGRANELAELTTLADRATPGAATAVICAIDGSGGIGKTALALHWAHRIAERFPDGQLYANLRGFDPTGTPETPAEVLHGFLEALATPSQMIPAGLDRRAALYRTRLAGRRVLVVLDNAVDAEQVRPLLPASPGCMAVVVSRNRLLSLISADGAHPVSLDLLSLDEARDLLCGRLGRARTAAEPDAIDTIIARCGRLPLALAIVAARASAHPHFPLTAYATELDDTRNILDAFSDGDPAADVRGVFSWSYRQLSPAAARLFRLLGLLAGPHVSAAAAASVAGLPLARARPPMSELTRSHLVLERLPSRYAMHDLLRSYAGELARGTESEPERDAATRRLLDHYLHGAMSASRLLHPRRQHPATPPAAGPGVVLAEFDDQERALAWFAAEHTTLAAAVRTAFRSGLDAHACQLAWALSVFHIRQGRWSEMIATQRTALDAARRLADRAAQAHTHRNIGFAAIELGFHSEADDHLQLALDLLGPLHDHCGQAQTHLGFSRGLELRGRHREALRHSQAAYELYQSTSDPTGQANALNSIGWCRTLLGEYHDARIACERALDLVRQTGDRWIEAATWDSLGQVHHRVANHRMAVACHQRALDLCRALCDRPHEAQTLVHLGDCWQATGDHDAARHAWQQALTIWKDLNPPDADRVRARLARSDRRATRPEDSQHPTG